MSEGLAQGPDMVARVVFEPATLRMPDTKPTTEPPCNVLAFVTGSGKSRLKSPMIKQQKLAEMPFRWKIFIFRFLAYMIK